MTKATFLKDLSTSGDWVSGAYLYYIPKPVMVNNTEDDDRTTHYIVVSWADTADLGPFLRKMEGRFCHSCTWQAGRAGRNCSNWELHYRVPDRRGRMKRIITEFLALAFFVASMYGLLLVLWAAIGGGQ